jgi:hypothetical protein
MFELYVALGSGLFNSVMDENHHIDRDALDDRMRTNMKEKCDHCFYKMEADNVDICPYLDRTCHNGFDCADCIEAEEADDE